MRLDGQHYMVLGLARSGMGAIELLRANGASNTRVNLVGDSAELLMQAHIGMKRALRGQASAEQVMTC